MAQVERRLMLAALLFLACCSSQENASQPQTGSPPAGNAETAAVAHTTTDSLQICSFNIQFLGHFKGRDNAGLAAVLQDFDVVVIQELVAPPYAMDFPDGTPAKPDPEAAGFFEQMKDAGFSYSLSEEDTGTGDRIHSNGADTEWWVAFFKPGVQQASDLPHGFLAEDRSNHPDYERVPYAFAFRAAPGRTDFVLISVHLQPGDSNRDAERRKGELAAIAAWVDANDGTEKDFLILGDMNIENASELAASTPADFVSLNENCAPTNTNPAGPKPYDHVMLRPGFTGEVDRTAGMKIIDLVAEMAGRWRGEGEFPGNPYLHDKFRMAYSDHHPVHFELKVGEDDD